MTEVVKRSETASLFNLPWVNSPTLAAGMLYPFATSMETRQTSSPLLDA
jgi:hypothetical protein